jgi:hypothetical protein
LSLLRGVTLEERAARVKAQYKSRQVAQIMRRGGQFASLKKSDHLYR